MKTVYLGADHAGYHMKESLKVELTDIGYHVEDLGAHEYDENDDYPEFASAVAQAVREHPGSFGILSCGNAEGIMIAANKFDGVRAGLGYSKEAARTMRQDDDANVISIPGRVTVEGSPLEIVKTFLETDFSGEERHKRRLKQVEKIEYYE